MATTKTIEPSAIQPRMREVLHCPTCHRPDARAFLSIPDRMHGVPGLFLYRRCESCGTVFQDPQVVEEDIHLLYPGAYYTRRPSNKDHPSNVMRRAGGGLRGRVRRGIQKAVAPRRGEALALPWRLVGGASRWLRERAFFDLVPDEMLPWQDPPGRALDVGCGNGDLMLRLAGVGWGTHGVEVDPGAAEVARGRTGCTVQVGDIMSLDPAVLGTFDLVTLSHVFEHLIDPGQALRVLARLLNDGGRLVLVYPNPESLGARLFGPEWFAWDAPRHLVLPPVRATLHLVRSAGMRCLSARTLSRGAADNAKQSRSYRRGEGPRSHEPDLLDRAFGGLQKVIMTFGPDAGEEVILSAECRR